MGKNLYANKDSIRNQIDEAKKTIQIVLKGKKSSPELTAAIHSLLLVVDVLVALFLEKKVCKNSSNSGLPPSRNNGSNGNRNRPTSGERDKKGNQLQNTEETESNETVSPGNCSNCDYDLSDVEVEKTEDRKKIDIIYKIVTHTVTSETKTCPDCATVNKGKFPKGMDGKIQYGI